MKELTHPPVKPWEDRMCETVMYYEILELHSALVKCQQDCDNKKNEIDALLLANRDLSDWFDALKVDYDALEEENQCLREKYT